MHKLTRTFWKFLSRKIIELHLNLHKLYPLRLLICLFRISKSWGGGGIYIPEPPLHETLDCYSFESLHSSSYKIYIFIDRHHSTPVRIHIPCIHNAVYRHTPAPPGSVLRNKLLTFMHSKVCPLWNQEACLLNHKPPSFVVYITLVERPPVYDNH